MQSRPLSRKITSFFTALAAIALFTPSALRNADENPGLPETEPVTTVQVFHPTGTPIERVDHSSHDGGVSFGGSSSGMPSALSMKIGKH